MCLTHRGQFESRFISYPLFLKHCAFKSRLAPGSIHSPTRLPTAALFIWNKLFEGRGFLGAVIHNGRRPQTHIREKWKTWIDLFYFGKSSGSVPEHSRGRKCLCPVRDFLPIIFDMAHSDMKACLEKAREPGNSRQWQATLSFYQPCGHCE